MSALSCRHVFLALGFGAAMSTLSAAGIAQDGPHVAPDPEDTIYRTGDIPPPAEVIQKLPKLRKYRAFLPDFVDLKRHFPPPGDQGEQNSCTAWAVGYAARGYYSSAVEGRAVTRAENVPSPSYIYDVALSERGVADCLAGMMAIEAFAILEQGAASLAQMPYDASSCIMPDPSLRKRASQFRIRRWRYIDPRDLDTIKGELAKGHPVIFGMPVGDNFMRHRGNRVYGQAVRGNAQTSGHAMVVVGYDERRQAVLIINSWGRGWGAQGYAWIDYGTFRDNVLHAFVMRPLGRDPPPPPRPAPKPEPAPVAVEPQPVPPPRPGPTPEPAPVAVEPQAVPPSPVSVVEDLGLQCAKVTLISEGGKQIARGFVANMEDAARVEKRLKDRAIAIELDVRPWPQCEVLLTLDRPLSANDRPAVVIRGAPKTLKKGDRLVIDIVSPRAPAHLHVAYIQADGSVVHLVQADAKNLKTVDSQQRLVFGDGLEGRQRFVIREPFGAEMIIALASRAPLFPEPRSQPETERDFLTALRRALLWKPDLSAPDRAVSAATAAIVTMEN